MDWRNNIPRAQNNISQSFLSTFLDFEPHQLVDEPTRINGNTANILDLFLVENIDMINCVEVIPGVIDRLAVLATLSCFDTRSKLHKWQVLNFKQTNWENLKQQLNDYLLVNFNNVSFDEACKLWIEIFWQCVKKNINLMTLISGNNPWVTKKIKSLITDTNRLFRKLKKSPNSVQLNLKYVEAKKRANKASILAQ
jgi:hypothetical protein